jgi:VanZ family protein
MLLIWLLSSMSKVPSFDDVPFRDKGIHFMEYGVLAALLAHALRGTWSALSLMRLYAGAVVCTVVWGLSDEIHQAFVPGRSSDIKDVLADSIGALIGTALYMLSTSLLRRFTRTSS